MRLGYRIVEPPEAGKWKGELVQVSLYKNWGGSAELLRQCARSSTDEGIPHVLHPVGYSLLVREDVEFIQSILPWAGEALLVHDERSPEGERLEGELLEQYETALETLRKDITVSVENSTFTADMVWFWQRMGGSVTLDMGHMEVAGINSLEFTRGLPRDIVERVDYIHMHHNNGTHGGITDHWPLRSGCRELQALEELARIKPDVGVILEINEREETGESLRLLDELREGLRD